MEILGNYCFFYTGFDFVFSFRFGDSLMLVLCFFLCVYFDSTLVLVLVLVFVLALAFVLVLALALVLVIVLYQF